MLERETRSEQARGEQQAPRPARSRLAILDLQRSAGNRAVARLLARQPAAVTELPPVADNLRRFRTGMPRLQALAARAAPPVGVDIEPALGWLGEVVETLRLVEPIVDPSMLVFESTVVSGHDEEYGAAGAQIRPQVRATLQVVAPIARDTGAALRRAVVEAVNASTVADEDRAGDPRLPALDRATAWRERASALAALARTVDRDGAGLAAAALVCEDAALALLQARAVINARETWRTNATTSAPLATVTSPTRPRDEVDDIFADAGYAPRQSLRPDGRRDDWCGMFVAAAMYRGAALDRNVRMAFAHTDNLHNFFTYSNDPINRRRTPVSVWAEGRWWGVREYHESRGLTRTWAEGAAAVAAADIRPGDVVLIRHSGARPADAIADHIAMVDSYDATSGRLVTLEGNVIEGIRADAAGDARRTADGELESTSTPRSSSAVHIRNLRDGAPAAGAGAYRPRGRHTVFGVGRPSLVDFENHAYGTLPVPERYRYVSPDEIRRRSIAVPLAPTSTLESPAHGPYRRRVAGG
jgi:hypothetical protein